jgi:hypothetical protein
VKNDPFDTIESAQEFLGLFNTAITSTLADVRADLESAQADSRRADALRLAIYKLEKLDHHISRSARMANDLRLIRRLLFEERTKHDETQSLAAASSGD